MLKSFFRVLWLASGLLLLYVLFSTYAEMSPTVFLTHDRSQAPVDRQLYFYGAAGIFLIYNILLFIIVRMVPFLPKKALVVPNKAFWFSDREHRKALNGVIQSWVFILSALINMLFLILLEITGSRNHVHGDLPFENTWHLPVLLAALVLLPLGLFIRLNMSKLEIMDNRDYSTPAKG
ncbi:MAG: hypothetical protein V4543_15040 [Bacteroidota bacterium]